MKKTALITGATSGIGEATATKLAAAGYNLVITGRREERLLALATQLTSAYECEVLPLAFDVRNRSECEAAIASLPASFAQIDVLVNNAGLAAGMEHLEQGDPSDWDAMIDTNVKGLLYITKQVAIGMTKTGKGHIVNLGSIAGTQTYENGATYCASKHAVHALSQGMRIDFLKHGIKVTEIRPGMVETEFSVVRFHGDQERADNVYTGVKPLTASDIADTICWAVSLPHHVNIDEIVMTPTAQANAYYTYRQPQ